MLDVHHPTGAEYLQSYLDEYCYEIQRKIFY